MNRLSAIDITDPGLMTRASRRQVALALLGLASMAFVPLTNVRRAQAHRPVPGISAMSEDGPMEFAVSADGTRIAYQRAGEGPPLVLVHGSMVDHTEWSQLMPSLGETFTVYAVDRRGRGQSGATDSESYAIEREFEDIVAVIEAIEEPVYLLGHSYGGLCTLEAALQTDKILKLVVYEPPMLVPPDPRSSQWANSIISEGTIGALDQMLAEGNNEDVALTFARDIAQVPEEAIDAFRALPTWQVSVDMADTIVHEVHAVQGYVFEPQRFRDLSITTLLLMGSESPPYLQASTEAVAAALPNERVVTLEGQGHLAMHSDPEGFTHQVVAFLNDER